MGEDETETREEEKKDLSLSVGEGEWKKRALGYPRVMSEWRDTSERENSTSRRFRRAARAPRVPKTTPFVTRGRVEDDDGPPCAKPAATARRRFVRAGSFDEKSAVFLARVCRVCVDIRHILFDA